MKRSLWLVWLIMFSLVFIPGCKKKPPVAGQASAKDILKLIPENPQVLMSMNIHSFAMLPLFDKMIQKPMEPKENAPFKDYQDFVAQTGIDAKKDVYFFVLGVYGDMQNSKEMNVAGVANLRYDAAKILALLKKNNVTLTEESYEGHVIYGITGKEDRGKEFRFAFLDSSNIAMGTPGKIKAVIDLFKGKGQNALASGKTKDYLGRINSNAMFWVMIGNLSEILKKQAPGSLPIDTSKIEAFLGYVDFQNSMLNGEFKLLCPDKKANDQLAQMLNGFKGLGAMGASSPEGEDLGKLLNSLSITSSSDDVKLAFSIPEELLNKMAEKAREKAKAKIDSMSNPPLPQESQAPQ